LRLEEALFESGRVLFVDVEVHLVELGWRILWERAEDGLVELLVLGC
jgi:hypothetical protein